MLLLIAFCLFALSVYLFIKFIVQRDHGHKEPVHALLIAMGFGLIAVIFASILNGIFLQDISDSVADRTTSMLPLSTLIYSSLSIGFIEESLKIIPLAFFIYKKRYFDELTDGIIYFGIVGLTFGILEDVSYALSFGGGVGVARILLSPYLHTAFTIIFGMQFIKHKIIKRSWTLVFLGYIGAVMAHAVYDFFAFRGGILGAIVVLTMTITLNVIVFVFFRRSQKIDESLGMSAIGINKFCRHCGSKNPDETLFCSYCGKYS